MKAQLLFLLSPSLKHSAQLSKDLGHQCCWGRIWRQQGPDCVKTISNVCSPPTLVTVRGWNISFILCKKYFTVQPIVNTSSKLDDSAAPASLSQLSLIQRERERLQSIIFRQMDWAPDSSLHWENVTSPCPPFSPLSHHNQSDKSPEDPQHPKATQ